MVRIIVRAMVRAIMRAIVRVTQRMPNGSNILYLTNKIHVNLRWSDLLDSEILT